MAGKASAHPRHLIARGQVEVLYGAMARLAFDAPGRVRRVIEGEIWGRNLYTGDGVARLGLVPYVALLASARSLTAPDGPEHRVITRMAGIADRGFGQEILRAPV